MSGRGTHVFAAAFLASFATLFAAWIGLETLANLEEFLAVAGPDRPWYVVALRHFEGVVAGHGVTLVGAVALASAGLGGVVMLRVLVVRSRTMA